MQNDLVLLVYMWVIESLFNNLFLNRHEKLTAGNIDIYEQLVKGLLKYMEDWKLAQLQRKKRGVPNWIKSFLAHKTYKNLRVAVSGFFHFARYMLNDVFMEEDGLVYVPMLCSNQLSLEGKFSG